MTHDEKTKMIDWLEVFVEFLKSSDWRELTFKGDVVTLSEGDFKTVERFSVGEGRWVTYENVVTLLPDGRYVRWSFENGLTEYQDDSGPAEYGEPEITVVTPVEKVITTVEWVPV